MTPALRARILALGAFGTAILVAVSTWWRDTSSASLQSAAALVTAAGRICGLLAVVVVLTQVIVIMRPPWLDHRLGSGVLLRWHSCLSQYTLWLIAGHILLIVTGYAALLNQNPPRQGLHLVLTYPYIWAGAAAAGMYTVVGATSHARVRPHLPRQLWHALHLLAYIAIPAALLHQLLDGAEFAREPGNRGLWLSLYGVVAAVAVEHRVLRPLRLAFRHRLRVVSITADTPRHTSVVVTGRGLSEVAVGAGQYLTWRFLAGNLGWQGHPFSLSRRPDGRTWRLTVQHDGDHTSSLRGTLRPGTRVIVNGPYGHLLVPRKLPPAQVLLIAGGVGLAPLLGVAQELDALGQSQVTIIYRCRTTEDVLFRSELEALVGQGRTDVHYLIGARSPDGDAGLLSAAALIALVPDLTQQHAFVCGSPGLVALVRAELAAAGVPGRSVTFEEFAL